VSLELPAVVDCAFPSLLDERGVGTFAQLLHVDLFLEHREPVRVELREVEHVADETFEANRLLADDLERCVPQLRIVDDALTQRRHVAADRSKGRPQLV
jgi:hypothetical protein